MNPSNPMIRFGLIAVLFIVFVTIVQFSADRWMGGQVSSPSPITPPKAQPKGKPLPDFDYKNYAGEVFSDCKEPYVVIRFLFREGSEGHIGAMKLIHRLSKGHSDRILTAGLVDETSLSSPPNAIPLTSKWDTIRINGKEEFTLPGKSGKTRKVRFSGMEGKNYQLADLEQAVQIELKKRKVQPHPPAPPM